MTTHCTCKDCGRLLRQDLAGSHLCGFCELCQAQLDYPLQLCQCERQYPVRQQTSANLNPARTPTWTPNWTPCCHAPDLVFAVNEIGVADEVYCLSCNTTWAARRPNKAQEGKFEWVIANGTVSPSLWCPMQVRRREFTHTCKISDSPCVACIEEEYREKPKKDSLNRKIERAFNRYAGEYSRNP